MVHKRHEFHGMAHSAEYAIWTNLKQRCLNAKCPDFADYGAKGIWLCQRWRESFAAFFEDMGPRPSPAHSIDRENNNSGYYASNCHWATKKEQGRNRKNNKHITFRGRRMTVSEAVDLTGNRVSRQCADWRIRNGWRVEEALATTAGALR